MILSGIALGYIFGEQFGWQVMPSIALHELAHAAVFFAIGVPTTQMLFLVILAFVSPDKEKLKNKPRLHIFYAILAGPTANFLLVIFGLVMAAAVSESVFWTDFARINAELAFFNLIPILAVVDGTKMLRQITESLDEDSEGLTLILVFGLSSVLAAYVAIKQIVAGQTLFMTFILYWLLFSGIKKQFTDDDPANAFKPDAMTKKQAYTMLMVQVVMIVFSFMFLEWLPQVSYLSGN